MIAQGTTALEVKSGYGLSVDAEIKMLRVIKRLKESFPITIRATFLGAHALGELARWAEGEVRGEITIVVAGASDDERRDASGLGDDEAIAAAVRDRMDAGASRKEAAAEVADHAGLSKRYVYDVSLRTVDDT